MCVCVCAPLRCLPPPSSSSRSGLEAALKNHSDDSAASEKRIHELQKALKEAVAERRTEVDAHQETKQRLGSFNNTLAEANRDRARLRLVVRDLRPKVALLQDTQAQAEASRTALEAERERAAAERRVALSGQSTAMTVVHRGGARGSPGGGGEGRARSRSSLSRRAGAGRRGRSAGRRTNRRGNKAARSRSRGNGAHTNTGAGAARRSPGNTRHPPPPPPPQQQADTDRSLSPARLGQRSAIVAFGTHFDPEWKLHENDDDAAAGAADSPTRMKRRLREAGGKKGKKGKKKGGGSSSSAAEERALQNMLHESHRKNGLGLG